MTYIVKKPALSHCAPFVAAYDLIEKEISYSADPNRALRFRDKEDAQIIADEVNGLVLPYLKSGKGILHLTIPHTGQVAYIKEVIGPSTVTWTKQRDEAGIFSAEDCVTLQHQYSTQIEEI